jgi:hypothetical protein
MEITADQDRKSSYRRSNRFDSAIRVMLVSSILGSCAATVVPPAADNTKPSVKMDLYNVDPNADPIGLNDQCCVLRRDVPDSTRQLTLVASAIDKESGIKSLVILARVIRSCQAQPSDGTLTIPIEDSTTFEVKHVDANSPSLPTTLLANSYFRMSDLLAECPHSKIYVDDASGTHVVDGPPQITKQCGIRLFATGENGVGGESTTATALLVLGPMNSGAFPCADVPF